ncbi:hypothetical protein scyTo_0020679 [Scyliorhinus torazame]|uniref:V-SNARE coiled-coil homology domain-containing protein n=1 Tax=Scyliorhinus torazame TaxID=75743 RepID=A0A401PZE4_SCYTO|nr:hypothetical protein [Scyliorhinus torazame]
MRRVGEGGIEASGAREEDTYIQKTKKSYIDSRARRNLGSINTELQDVQRIMVANIEEVLQRGEALSALDSKASSLSSLSKKYRQDAKYLNMRSTYAKLAAVAVFSIMLIVTHFQTTGESNAAQKSGEDTAET